MRLPLRFMTHGTAALGSREDSSGDAGRGCILVIAAARVVAVEEDVMADMAYAVVLVGGFAVLILTLRGLQRL
jgi:hypothetical protein